MSQPDQAAIEQALRDASAAHHDYQQVTLKGERDELWAGFYAAFVLGRVGDFAPSSQLTDWLSEAPGGDDWAASAAEFVVSRLAGG